MFHSPLTTSAESLPYFYGDHYDIGLFSQREGGKRRWDWKVKSSQTRRYGPLRRSPYSTCDAFFGPKKGFLCMFALFKPFFAFSSNLSNFKTNPKNLSQIQNQISNENHVYIFFFIFLYKKSTKYIKNPENPENVPKY